MSKRIAVLFAILCVCFLSSCEEEIPVVSVTGVKVSPTSLTLVEGETGDLIATVSPDNADNKTVTWASKDGSIASVSNGRVTGIKVGSTIIVVTTDDGGFNATCSVTVISPAISISSISLSKTELTLIEGDSETLTATVKPDDATDKTVRWSSSDPSVATVDEGEISALKEGTATITAMAGEKTASCKVTVEKKVIAVESVEIDKTEIELVEGESFTLVATVKPDDATDKTVTWTSSDTAVATVENGKITAIKEGIATISAKAGDKTAFCNVTVKCKTPSGDGNYVDEYGVNHGQGVTIDGITWAPVNCGYKASTTEGKGYLYGKLYQWGRKYGQGYGEPYFNSSDTYRDESVPTIAARWEGSNDSADPNTFYYGLNEPYNWISDDSNFWNKGSETNPEKNELYDPCPEGWRVPTAAELSTLASGNHSDLIMVDGVYGAWYTGSTAFSESLEAKIFLPATGGRFADNWFHRNGAVSRGSGGNYWSSAMEKSGGVNMDFLGKTELSSTYKAFGFAVRCCRDDGEVVSIPVTGISLDQTSVSLEEGQSITLKVTVKPDNATNKTVTWTSSNTSIATVSNGTVTALSAGSATITASAGGKTAKCSITVKNGGVDVASVSLNKSSLILTKGASETLVATIKPDNATNKTVIWTSSDGNVATVDSNGTVVAVGGGSATISARAGGKSADCAVTVIVPVTGISLDQSSINIEEGQTITLVAKIEPEDATNKTVIWTSDNPSVATVEDGTVKALKLGTAIILAKTQDGDREATCIVSVVGIDSMIKVSFPSIDITLGSMSYEGSYVKLSPGVKLSISISNYSSKAITVTGLTLKCGKNDNSQKYGIAETVLEGQRRLTYTVTIPFAMYSPTVVFTYVYEDKEYTVTNQFTGSVGG